MMWEFGELLRNAPCGFDAAYSRQADVEQNQVGLQFLGLEDCLFPVRCLTNHVQSGITRKKGTDHPPDYLVVIDD
jgi:hypothetical protein